MKKARRIVREFRPDIAIGVGGYASGPTLKAAQRAGVPTLLQEQNSYPGVTNKMLAPKAGAICVAYPGLERFFPADRIVMTGNPVRKALFSDQETPAEAKKALGFDPERPLVLVVGGSLGAHTLNQAVSEAVRSGRSADADFQVLWQTGKNEAEECAGVLEGAKADNVRATAFISDMARAYRAADLVVARAGAGTISELQLLAKPSILVPSPNVAEDHQRHNALALAQRGAAIMILDKDAADKLWDQMEIVVSNSETLRLLGESIAAMALPDSDDIIVDTALRLIGTRKNV
ncbi:MAG: UDP-N-acetylglucosamine--N-acetylmuramyl-(pentapeptide) pyrophosphoryl-undecaprenol N-acetylglucosamine transferase [Muribaculaceae bacterium]|nr:UDP-N-acetylglucosamine--N-acetylmuramyl-(pentapeptide) pyrophosphoryl-undecaprenol N-acetylglucosamine transferase [Muribaculaceae bacterium]